MDTLNVAEPLMSSPADAVMLSPVHIAIEPMFPRVPVRLKVAVVLTGGILIPIQSTLISQFSISDSRNLRGCPSGISVLVTSKSAQFRETLIDVAVYVSPEKTNVSPWA
jgi:hypothetical protein